MNNSAFKDLLSKAPATASHEDQGQKDAFQKPGPALGSRMRSSVPMTPRHIPGQRINTQNEFARQVAQATSRPEDREGPPLKKFKSNAAPKGTKLASGYVDRASRLRDDDHQGETGAVADKVKRVKALEEMYKLQQIDLETFEKLRDAIGVGGDVGSTHLVRGLDWKLLARVRRGEDVAKSNDENRDEAENVDVDEEFDKVFEKEIAANPAQLEKASDDEDIASSDVYEDMQQPLSRDDILRRFKQNRNQPASMSIENRPEQPVLNDKFKKVPTKPNGSKKEKFTETVNGRRREVLLITNLDGSTKRKTRWLDPELIDEQIPQPQEAEEEQVKPTDATKKAKKPKVQQNSVLGMEVPAQIAVREAARKAAEEAEDQDEDIFQGAGDDYDPLGDINSDDSDSGSDKDKDDSTAKEHTDKSDSKTMKRNYFGAAQTDADENDDKPNPMAKDPTILAALKRAADIRRREEEQSQQTTSAFSNSHNTNSNTSDRSQAFLAKLRERDRQDAADLDMGFGESRFGDDDEDESGGADLLDFNHDGDGDEDGNARKAKNTGKRKPKKRKGDKNSFADVMSVIEKRKQ